MTYRPFFQSRWSRNRHGGLQYRTVTPEALERIAALHAIEKDARVPPEQRVAICQAKAAPRRDDLGRWSGTQLPRVSVRNPAGDSHPVYANPTEARVPIPRARLPGDRQQSRPLSGAWLTARFNSGSVRGASQSLASSYLQKIANMRNRSSADSLSTTSAGLR